MKILKTIRQVLKNLFTKLMMSMNSIVLTILTTNFLKSDHINGEIQAMITYIPYDKILSITFQGRDTSDPTVVSSRQQWVFRISWCVLRKHSQNIRMRNTMSVQPASWELILRPVTQCLRCYTLHAVCFLLSRCGLTYTVHTDSTLTVYHHTSTPFFLHYHLAHQLVGSSVMCMHL